jgi:hypothetical protein
MFFNPEIGKLLDKLHKDNDLLLSPLPRLGFFILLVPTFSSGLRPFGSRGAIHFCRCRDIAKKLRFCHFQYILNGFVSQ